MNIVATVFSDLKGVVVETPDPDSILRGIPTAFKLDAAHVGMPHELSEVILLSHMGISVRSPIIDYYSWPHDQMMVKKPFDHQFITAEFFTKNPHGFCMNGIGTGKTLSALWAADYLLETGAARRVLIA